MMNDDADIPIEEDTGDSWLISYADMMTLIACFFILMMAFANYDPVGFQKKAEEVSKHFHKDKYKTSELELEHLREELSTHPEIKKFTKVSIKDGALVLSFSGSVLFPSGSHTVNEDIAPVVDSMIDLIKVKDPNYRILVEGHTDNQKLGAGSPFENNWALSGARAASIVGRFERFGFEPKNLVSLGYGDTRPLAPNEDSKGRPLIDNMNLNRRVVIKVLVPKVKSDNVKMGLGIYFKDGVDAVPSESFLDH